MAKQIKHLDVHSYFTSNQVREETDNKLKDRQIINVETLKNDIVRFWYLENN